MKKKDIEKILQSEKFMRQKVFQNKPETMTKKIKEINEVIDYIEKLEYELEELEYELENIKSMHEHYPETEEIPFG